LRKLLAAASCVITLCGAVTPPLLPGSNVSVKLATADADGLVAYDTGDYQKAVRLWRPTLIVLSHYSDDSRTAKVAYELSTAQFQLQRLPDALLAAKKARDLHRRLKFFDALADDHDLIGRIEFALGNYETALGEYEDALIALAERERNAEFGRDRENLPESDEYRNIGAVELGLGQLDEAYRSFVRARTLDEGTSNDVGVAYTQELIGQTELAHGHTNDALSAFDASLAGYRSLAAHLSWDRRDSIGSPRGKNVSGWCLDCPTPPPPVNLYGDELLRDLLNGDPVGLVLGQARALSDTARVEISVTNNFTYDTPRAGHLERARKAARSAFILAESINDRADEAGFLAELALIEARERQPEAAASTIDHAVTLTRSVTSPTSFWEAAYDIARTEALIDKVPSTMRCTVSGERKGIRRTDVPRALRTFEQAIAKIEQMRARLQENYRSGYLAGKLSVYDDYISYLINLDRSFPGRGCGRKAFEVFERRQARAFLERVSQSAARRFSGVLPKVSDAENSISAQVAQLQIALAQARSAAQPGSDTIASLEIELDAARVRKAKLEASIKFHYKDSHYKNYYLLLNPQPLDSTAIQASLHRGEAMLVYDVLPSSTVLWVVTPDHSGGFRLFNLHGGTSAARTKVSAFLDGPLTLESAIALQPPITALQGQATLGLPAFERASADLYRWLFPSEARAMIARASTVFVVPSNSLYAVPFEALVTRLQKDRPPHYLIQDHSIAYLSSASLLGVLRRKQPTRAALPLLAFANPTYEEAMAPSSSAAASDARSRPWPPLLGTQDEVQAIADALKPQKSKLFLGPDASVQTVKKLSAEHRLKDYRFVVFATHADLSNQVSAKRPSLVMAHPAAGGYLTMADVLGLSFDAQLIMLSACNSNGKTTNGDGVESLTQAFMYAGTPIVSVTDWEILDAVAPAFSARLFQLLAHRKTPAEALRQTKIDLITGKLHVAGADDRQFQHPFFWAGTVLFGDGDACIGTCALTTATHDHD